MKNPVELEDIDYKAEVLKHYDVEVYTDPNDIGKCDITYEPFSTLDGYEIYIRLVNRDWSKVFSEESIVMYAEGFADSIYDDLRNEGSAIYICEEVAEACGFDDDGYEWERLYEYFQ